MSAEVIRYGIVGLGRAGWNIHVNALRPRDDAQVVAVVDPLAERREEAAAEFGCQTYENIEEMVKQEDVEVVVVATPNVSHGPDTIAALGAGKNVVVEKPMAVSVDEADRMIAASEEAGKKLFVHQNWRFNREFTHLQEVATSGKIGQVYHIRNYLSSFTRRDDWQTMSKYGGGVLNNTCPHFIDMLLQLAGAPIVQVMGDLQQIASAGDVEDHVKAFMRAENGCTIDMEVSSAQNISMDLPKWVLCGANGTLTCNGKESVIRRFDPEKAGKVESVDGAAKDRGYTWQTPPLEWEEETVEPVGPDIGSFYDNVTGVLRCGEAMNVTPESVREVIRVIAEIREGTDFPGVG